MHTSSRIVIVGGGISGLSIAARVAQAGMPVTLLEASHLGFGASTRNQGWLVSGAWFAPEQPELARMCYESLQQTLRFSPECVEQNCRSMIYLAENPETDTSRWTSAWSNVGIPYEPLTSKSQSERFSNLAVSRSCEAFELPDLAIRTNVLLRRLADAAVNAGAEIRTGTPVVRLIQRGDSVRGVETGLGESISARLVILAGNAAGGFLFPGFGTEAVGAQREAALVVLKTHLVALRAEISRTPLCVIDAGGFNHVPHPPHSVFGSNRWLPVRHGEDIQTTPAEINRIWNHVQRLFPDVRREAHTLVEWAGTTVQAMHVEQIEPGLAPLPTVVDHQKEYPRIENLLSVFPGRATLWPHLAEQARQIVLQKLERVESQITPSPWGTPIARWQAPTKCIP